MTREEIYEIIKQLVEEEHGNIDSEDQLLKDVGIDSFGSAMLWLGVEELCKITIVKEYKPDYSTFTIKDMIDLIESKQNVSA